MKKSYLILGMLIAVLMSCGDDNSEQEKKENVDTTAKVQTRKQGELKIAFYYQDSVAANFEFFREQDSIITKKQIAYQNELKSKQQKFQNYILTQQQRQESGLLSQNEIMQVQQSIQNQEQQLYEFQETRGAALDKEAVQRMTDINKKIKKFSEDYCNENGIDILLIYADGSQVQFITSEMDLTNEFVAYLNKRQGELADDIQK